MKTIGSVFFVTMYLAIGLLIGIAIAGNIIEHYIAVDEGYPRVLGV